MSRLFVWIFDADGVTRRKPPLPTGLGKMLPSMSQVAFQPPYNVSSGNDSKTGLRGYIFSSIICHMASDSAIWVSESITGCIFSSFHFKRSLYYASPVRSAAFFSLWRLCRNLRDHTDVMLSSAKHLAFPANCKDEILRLRLRMILSRVSRGEKVKKPAQD